MPDHALNHAYRVLIGSMVPREAQASEAESLQLIPLGAIEMSVSKFEYP